MENLGEIMAKNVISILDLSDSLNETLRIAGEIKKKYKNGESYSPLEGKSLGMIFEKPSTRTRISFEVGTTQLGGHALYLSPKDLQLGRGETIADTAKVLSRYVDGIMYRAFEHDMMVELAENSTVPVISGLDDVEHPCQIVADLLTIKEKKDDFDQKMVYVGDGNNVCHSLLLGSALVGMDMTACVPEGYDPDQDIVEKAKEIGEENDADIDIQRKPSEAVEDADVIYTDVWVSMGDEEEKEKRMNDFEGYQINKELISKAKEDVIVMHCLPAHRGVEITSEVMDGPHSVVFDQAENRLHAQKAIMAELMG
uniref:ornithine carbamoyltransferase n=1 Tax=uncultured organism TaxID=155900 RepID=M1PQB0_9ZZZZ|nr:ornithine carbamoyltransferase [uncultured organism]